MKKIGLIASIGLFLLYYFKSKQNEISDEESILDRKEDLDDFVPNTNICPNVTIKTILQVSKVENKKCYCRSVLEITNHTSEDVYITTLQQASSVFKQDVKFKQGQKKNSIGWTRIGANFTKRITFKEFGECSGLTEEQIKSIKSALEKASTSQGARTQVSFIESDVSFIWTNDMYYEKKYGTGTDVYRCSRYGMKDCYIEKVQV